MPSHRPILPALSRSFRLGTSSFVLPDHLLPNVEWLQDRVDDVQILLLEPEGDLPDPDAIARMAAIGRDTGLSYSVHLPTLVALDGDPCERSAQAVAAMLRLIEPLAPSAGVLHIVPAPPEAGDALHTWVERARCGLARIAELAGVDPLRLAVENQWAYDVACNRALAEHSGCSLCLDLGHVHYAHADPLPILAANLECTNHIHIHGVADRDHRSLEHFPPLAGILQTLQERAYQGVVTVEVFGVEAFESSLKALATSWPGSGGGG
ncbi:MAG: cobamide remodeling phosphodiesterase CbiR [Pseudomonadota bacterium]